MPTQSFVAIAGGSSPGLGTSMVTALLSSPTFTPIILSRTKDTQPAGSMSTNAQGVQVRHVDYESVPGLTTALSGVHTVLSVIMIGDSQAWLRSQLNLLHAARAAGAVRFAPSEWGLGTGGHELLRPTFEPKLKWWRECLAIAAEAEAKGERFEVARFSVGMFMNYLGYGAPFEHERATGGRGEDEPNLFFFFRDLRVNFPVTDDGGVAMVTMTDMQDIGEFVRAAVELPEGEWDKEMGIAGDTLKLDKIIAMFGEIVQKNVDVNFENRESVEKDMQAAEASKDSMGFLWNQFKLCFIENKEGIGIIDGNVNRKCPHVRPMTVRRFLERFWAGRR